MPFDKRESFPTRSDLMAASRLSSPFLSTPEECFTVASKIASTSLISSTSANRVSIREAISIPYLPIFLPTRAVQRCGLSDPFQSRT